MSMQATLMPVFAQVSLTFVLLFWMQFLRMRAISRGEVPPHSIAPREPNWPPRAAPIGNAYHNQLETPVLVGVVSVLGMVAQRADSMVCVLSWVCVGSGGVHASVHRGCSWMVRRAP